MKSETSKGPVFGRKQDLYIILGILLVLGLWVIWSYFIQPKWFPDKNLQYAWVYHDDELLRKIPLDGVEIRWELEVPCHDERHSHEGNTTHKLVIVTHSDKSISVEEAECPDHICVNTGRVSREGQSIACLPNHVIIKIGSADSPAAEGDNGIDG